MANEELAEAIGRRIRHIRAANRQTQLVVADLAGVTSDYLYQIERGKKLPAVPVMLAIAKALRVSPSEILSTDSSAQPRSSAFSDGHSLRVAMTSPIFAQPALSTAKLKEHIALAWNSWQHSRSRYSTLDGLLPQLVTATRNSLSSDSGPEINACAAELYGLVRTVAKRLGHGDLALLAADRACQCADETPDVRNKATAAWNMAHVLLAGDQAEVAAQVADGALSNLRLRAMDDVEGLALHGALLCVSAMAKARLGREWPARDQLREAHKISQVTGERNTGHTAFGPTNVAMHAVSVELEAGDVAESLRLAEKVQPGQRFSIERRVAFMVDQAKGFSRQRDYGSALVMLTSLATEAPEDLAHRPASRLILETVVQRGRGAVARQAAQLADRFSIPV
ncbi:helix-turn-helix domain-containing protein [Actinokineospora bangkokensis]|uniref:HTH cro/C1-type domain-containing protein n=1 Tax=Actinokineospora bangkokensis TaxID=1193682 RepID=A0A1Q9LGF1_9PSEU|nr:helix-turn-helix transcriptional regulator [Actinokineospora bangkokensis]OLR91085.1 hypothetical protein BJP25_31625 [Actinokineospora bangkokensis]